MLFSPLMSEEYKYEFHWLSIPVAELLIIKNKQDDNLLNNNNEAHFQLTTKGPLKLFRNYSVSGYIQSEGKASWNYYVSGFDRGQPEEKLITYFDDKAPNIKIFIDDKGVSALKIDPIIDRGAIDPFTLLMKIPKQLAINQNCNGLYFLMDGKRRYEANVIMVKAKKIKINTDSKFSSEGSVYHCRLMILGDKNKTNKNKAIWPFNGSNKVVDIWFAQDFNYHAVEFQFKTPLGKFTGKLITD